MAEMEKEGRPPENKRSRKPAHPVKREINEEMKSFAENTMNELLGWYGYDKVELRDSDNLDIGDMPPHISFLRENVLPNMAGRAESSDGSPDGANNSHSLPSSRNGVTEPSTSHPAPSEHGTMPIMVPVIPPPLIQPSAADEDVSSVQIVCAWCQKVGVKRYSLSMGSELKNFCSEKCFAACRRAYFKRNKARGDDGVGGIFPQLCFTQDTPTPFYKAHSSQVLVCDWCKHIRHTKEYLDFGAGERRLQFCSAKCLNQYKMDIFYKETQAALPGGLCHHAAPGEGALDGGGGVQLLTPESWGSPLTDLRRKAPSPGGPSSTSAQPPATSPRDTAAGCSPSPSSSARMSTPKPPESPAHPPVSALRQPVGVPPGSPPMVMTPRGPMPLPLFMEHQMMQQMRPPFLRPSSHPPGRNSPLSNPLIPGIGAPPPPRTLGLASSPMHRPLVPPHMHPSSNAPPGLIPPYPLPGFPPFPPVNMMPNGHGPLPLPPMMNFGMPTLAPLVPPPTLLVPYPIIVPLPVPIPIPIPIPFGPPSSRGQPESSSSLHSSPEPCGSPGSPPGSPGYYGGLRGGQSPEAAVGGRVSPLRTQLVDLTVTSEKSFRNVCPPGGGASMEGVMDLTVGQRSRPPLRVKTEEDSECGSPPAAGVEDEEEEGGALEASPFCSMEAVLKQVNPSTPRPTTQQPPPSPPAPCNPIVNGAGGHSIADPFPDQSEDGIKSDEEPPPNGELEHDALKENTCSTRERGAKETDGGATVEGKADPDSSLEEGGHALPLLSTGGCVLIQPVPKPAVEKAALLSRSILSRSIGAPLASAGSPEPPHKRRCLRIRNQNK